MKNIILFLFVTVCLSSCSSDETSNSANINRVPLDFTEVMSFQVDTLELDMISSSVENSFFITYSSDNGFNENVLKYNVSSNSQTDLVHPDISESRQIEIINDNIYSISSNDIYKFDLNLSNLSNINSTYNNAVFLRATNYQNDLLFLFDYNLNNIGRFDINSESYDNHLSTFPYTSRFQSDAEIINDVIYIFGGKSCDSNEDFVNNTCDSFNEVNIYNIIDDTWNQEFLPYQINESFTAIYGNTILVSGNKNPDQTNSFLGEYDVTTNTYNDLLTSLDLENITIRGITVFNDEVYIAYADLINPMPDIMTIKVVKASLL